MCEQIVDMCDCLHGWRADLSEFEVVSWCLKALFHSAMQLLSCLRIVFS